MKKVLCVISFFLIIMPGLVHATKSNKPIKAVFTQDGYLWVKIEELDERITTEQAKYSYPPQWSHDGKMILYQKEVPATMNPNQDVQSEIWVYSLDTKIHTRIFYDGINPKWSPKENVIAFQSGGVLNISNLKEFKNVALGVSDYQWFPNGKGFIASSSATLRPDGWTNPVLYKLSLEKEFSKVELTTNVKPFFEIPKELTNGKTSVMSINASDFAFSSDRKWISFIVSPTASMAMDSDMVCVISSVGTNSQVLDETIRGLAPPKWAPHTNLLGYIAGGGRIVFGFKNKKLKITELPVFKSATLTPPHFAEMDFTWVDDQSLIVSRVPETEWSNEAAKRPEPSLYSIHLDDERQNKITSHKKGVGDYQPDYLAINDKITWFRKSLTDYSGDIWIANVNGKNAELWMQNVDLYSFYHGL